MGYSNWRQDLTEVMTDKEDDKKVTEKNIKNKIVINPKLGEAIEALGGELIDLVEVAELEQKEKEKEDDKTLSNKQKKISMVKKQVLLKKMQAVRQGAGADIVAHYEPEGDQIDEKKGCAHTHKGEECPVHGKKECPAMVETVDSQPLQEYSSLVRQGIKVAGKRGGRAVQGGLKSGKSAAKNAVQKKEAGSGEKIGKVVGGVVGGAAGAAAGAGAASVGTGIAGGAVGEKVGGAIGKKIDKIRAKKRAKVEEELSVDQQMKISQEYNRKTPEEKKAANMKVLGTVKKVKREKDTRTDAQKMTDATGPRPGSRYRGD